ncbi:hypothetical protein BVC93_20210 [Mycobacterium sp. MS1601]|uniref:sensor histidine kinase n=1 Tax=Mycobacterium sp. MS1601 TaxID=1936029 RepID=UPI00097907C1|nr:GAF domain-containing sensor histidine kinase [Mycobacterium sp. MS1601]AQA04361.1 hypothetical protein BVC93_20210 [Mycobacterium sp. MS1601]
MSRAFVSLPTDRAVGDDNSDQWLERLTGARSSKPTFYAEWRRKSHGLDRAIEAIKAISAALCTTTHGPLALCEAVVDALGRHFDATSVRLSLTQAVSSVAQPPLVAVWPESGADPREGHLELEQQVRATRAPVVSPIGGGTGVGAPIVFGSDLVGTVLIELGHSAAVDDSDISILETVANQMAVALANAYTFDESERLRAEALAGWSEADRQATELESRNRQLESAHRRLAAAGQRQLINQERQRIARELHDSVAQHLISIGMNLEWCRQQGPHSTALQRRVMVSQDLTRAALTRMRAAIFELSALDDTRNGLRQALVDLAEQFRAATRLQVSARSRGTSRMLSTAVSYALFTIAQEAMFNVVRHAEATRAWIELVHHDEFVQVSVADDGTGDASAIRRTLTGSAPSGHDHRGLINIRQRVAEVGGSVTACPRRGGGTRVVVRVPLTDSTTVRGHNG